MIFGYSISGKIDLAQASFDMMPEKDVISWNSLISGYLQNGNYLKAVEIFAAMRREGVFYDETTFAVVLRACSGLEDNVLGVQGQKIGSKNCILHMRSPVFETFYKVEFESLFQYIKILLVLPPIWRKFDLDYLGPVQIFGQSYAHLQVNEPMEVNDAWWRVINT
ncbi:unnamed protein product [Fraxinus pennsylvanica]|uniref:Pentatricopeptide repeat-containing protein n=1 Tax=Fraxinus pennsylvanica TaxID=56036 RepID=A0AAD2DPA2_9LAMI|nr:unnamed protein product [Fraxinus pennsylvanica]